MTWRPIERLIPDGRPDSYPIGTRGGRPVPFGCVRQLATATAARHRATPRALLVCNDTCLFAAGLLGLLMAGTEVILPPNTQSGTVAEIAAGAMPVIDDASLRSLTHGAEIPVPYAAPDARVVFHTSGSTGAPKRITRTLDALGREATVLHQVWGKAAHPGAVRATVPHHHLFGLAFRVLWPLCAGWPLDAETDSVWETLLPRLRGGDIIVSSPAHLGRLTGIDPLPADRRPGLIFTAGAPLSRNAARETEAILGTPATEIFGSTETGAMATRRQRDEHTPWTTLPGTSIRRDAQGRMAVRSPYTDDWQQTQDVVDLTTDGFHFIGRADRIVKIEGERVSLPAIEAALTAQDLVEDAAVAVMTGGTDRLGAVLVLAEAGRIRLTALGPFQFKRFLRDRLAQTLTPSALPRVWRFADALPMRAMGKRDDAAILSLLRKPQA